jgi:hypothetical protein
VARASRHLIAVANAAFNGTASTEEWLRAFNRGFGQF